MGVHFLARVCTLVRIFAHFCAYVCPWSAFSRIFAQGCAKIAPWRAFSRIFSRFCAWVCTLARIFAHMCAPGAHFLAFLRKGVPKSHCGAHFLAFLRMGVHPGAHFRAFLRIWVPLARIFSHFCARMCPQCAFSRIGCAKIAPQVCQGAHFRTSGANSGAFFTPSSGNCSNFGLGCRNEAIFSLISPNFSRGTRSIRNEVSPMLRKRDPRP